jgi:hypothetical protein
MVDVTTAIVINRPPAVVAAVAGDPGHASLWLVHLTAVHWSVVQRVPGERLVLRTDDGPFPLELTTTWEAWDDPETTVVRLHTMGSPTGARRLLGGVLAAAMKRANGKDLLELKQLLERT